LVGPYISYQADISSLLTHSFDKTIDMKIVLKVKCL